MTLLDPIDNYSHPVSRREYVEGARDVACVGAEGLALRTDGKQQVIWCVPGPYSPRGFCYVEHRGGLLGVYW